MKHNDNRVRTGSMEQGTHIASFEQVADWDGWEGYEYWSAQLEAESELLADIETQAGAWMQPIEEGQEGRGDVLPF